jgi:hypothetical protein
MEEWTHHQERRWRLTAHAGPPKSLSSDQSIATVRVVDEKPVVREPRTLSIEAKFEGTSGLTCEALALSGLRSAFVLAPVTSDARREVLAALASDWARLASDLMSTMGRLNGRQRKRTGE